MNGDLALRALGVTAAILAAVAVIGVLTFAGPCVHDDGTVSACHESQVGIIVAGVIAFACALVSLFGRIGRARGVLLLVAAVCGVFMAVAPGNALALCMMATMRCRAVMQPFAQFIGCALAAVSVIAAIRALRARA